MASNIFDSEGLCDVKETSGTSDDSDNKEYHDTNDHHVWSSKTEYVLSMIGYCVGLGNIWRFPYVCMKNGGGAFLIPFFICLILCGIPVFFMETALGQFLGKSSWHAWNICPLMRGLGIAMTLMSIFYCIYSAVILGWTLIFLVNSFKSPLPWTLCGQEWNTPSCSTERKHLALPGNGTLLIDGQEVLVDFINGSFINYTSYGNETDTDLGNLTAATGTQNGTFVSSTEEFWLHNVLELSSGLGDLGGLPWPTAIALVVSNLFVFLGIVKGIQSSGKVVYVTATLPYLLLTVILILGCTLPGSGDGVLYYIKPDFSKPMSYEPWMVAAIQVFYSLGTGWGAILTMASYNKFNNDCMTDSILLCLCSEGTSIFGGFAIFTILGHMAYKANVDISSFAKSGAGLAFVVYPEAVSYLPLPQLWSIVFFLMLFSLGLDSMFSTVETVITVLADVWPDFFVAKKRVMLSFLTMAGITCIGLLFACRGGMYWFQLVDWYIAAFSLLLQAAVACVVISWVYGYDRFSSDVELMIGRKPTKFFELCLKFFTPFILLVLWVLTLFFYQPPTYEGYIYPAYARIFGWVLAVTPFSTVLFYAVFEFNKHRGSVLQRLRSACRPPAEWVPSSAEMRENYNRVSLDLDLPPYTWSN